MDAPNGTWILHDETCTRLFQAAVDIQKNLIVLLRGGSPLLFNKAFSDFCGVSGVREFLREFGPLPNRFVPHDAYFHIGKTSDPERWVEELAKLDEQDRIISMFSCEAEPYAFAVSVEFSVGEYAIVSFSDISQDLIKRIMIENDVSIDKESGAYDKEYFLHTAKSFQSAADFNEKAIGITMIELMTSDAEAETYLRDFTSSIKSNIRQSDMLVRWGKKTFLLAYLVDTSENAERFSKKLLNVMRQEPFESLNTISMRIGASVQTGRESIDDVIECAHGALKSGRNSDIVVR